MKHILTTFSALFAVILALAAPDWHGAGWIAFEADRDTVAGPAGKYIHSWTAKDREIEASGQIYGAYTLPQFRREFELRGGLSEATLDICGLGQFECYINGHKVGDHFLDPGWTRYDKEALYIEFDVKPYLRKGANAIGVMLGGGFFDIPNLRYYKIWGSMGAPRMIAALHLRYRDGSEEFIVSGDGLWKACPSAITSGSIYKGECFDATLEQKGWKEPGFDDSSWSVPVPVDFDTELIPQTSWPLTVRQTLKPVSVRACGDGWLYDMGQNFSGIFEISLKGKRGSTVVITPAETLREGRPRQFDTGGPHEYRYTLAGNGKESWRPQFSYYGQKWFLVSGAVPAGEPNPLGLPVITGFKGLHTCASAPRVGSFECSDSLFNRIYSLTDWAFRSNFASVFTDCPHREKLGWQEQTYLMFPSFAHIYDVQRHFHKVMRDVATSQLDNGCIPTIAPEYVRFEQGFEDTPEWGSSLIFGAWNIYKWYGDDSLMRLHYPAMKRYLAYLESRKGADGVIAYGLGDWLCVDRNTSLGVTSHLVYCLDLKLMASMASLMGLDDDKRGFEAEFAKAADDFNRRFLHDGIYDNDTQADYAIPLAVGVVPEQFRETALARLIAILERDGANTTGEVAHPYMLEVLAAAGQSELISRIHHQSSKPGYAYMINQGSTTLTEAWDGTLSQNHFANGHIVQWFYEYLAGIRQTDESVGFRHLVIQPEFVSGIDWVYCSFETRYGKVVSNWIRKGDGAIGHIEIPQGCDAVVRLPGQPERVLQSGKYSFRVI